MTTQLPFDLEAEQAQLKRKQGLIDAYSAQMLKPRQGQMVGNRYVGVSPFEGLATVLAAYLTSKGQDKLDAEQKELRGKYNTALQTGVESYMNTRDGKPGKFEDMQGLEGPPQTLEQPVKADPRAAAVQALVSGIAPLQEIGKADLTAMTKDRLTAKDLVGIAAPSSVFAAPNNPAMWQPKRDIKEVTGNLYDANDPKLNRLALGGTGPQTKTINGDLYEESPSTGSLRKLDNAPKVTVNSSTNVVNKGETKFMEGLGTASAKELIDAKATKVGAQRTIQSMNKLEQLDAQGVLSGPGAGLGMTIGSLAEAMGFPVDKKKLGTSQAYQGELMANLGAQLTGSLARSTTDKDMEILKAPLPELLNSREGRAALRRQAIAKAQEHIQYADDLHTQAAETFPDAAGLLRVTPGAVPVPQRGDMQVPNATGVRRYNPATGRIE